MPSRSPSTSEPLHPSSLWGEGWCSARYWWLLSRCRRRRRRRRGMGASWSSWSPRSRRRTTRTARRPSPSSIPRRLTTARCSASIPSIGVAPASWGIWPSRGRPPETGGPTRSRSAGACASTTAASSQRGTSRRATTRSSSRRPASPPIARVNTSWWRRWRRRMPRPSSSGSSGPHPRSCPRWPRPSTGSTRPRSWPATCAGTSATSWARAPSPSWSTSRARTGSARRTRATGTRASRTSTATARSSCRTRPCRWGRSAASGR